jgi:arginine decarboxylase
MIEGTNILVKPCALVVDDELTQSNTAGGRAAQSIVDELRAGDIEVVVATSIKDGTAVIISDAAIHCIFLNWNLGRNSTTSHDHAMALLRTVRAHNDKVPIFLMAEQHDHSITIDVLGMADECIWILEDTADFIAGRAIAAIARYLERALPPFASALLKYNQEREYSWAVPGHQGGVAFTKSPVGRIFYDFYGENLFRTDLGNERVELGSLLDHTGPIGASEKYSARVFGAHRTYSVINGTSGSNRTVISAALNEGEIALCDRNCHKSIEQGLTITGGIPAYLIPTRNRYGIIGPIHPDQMTPEAIEATIAANPLARDAVKHQPAYAVVTNCTYDGMCYHAQWAQQLLGQSVDRLHFDEAWYGFARFHPLYRDRYAMRGNPSDYPDHEPTLFATQSTHKLLAALSQASFIHVRDGRAPIEHERFNEAFMMHSTTSPLYPIIAANDVATAMMDGPGGMMLISETLKEAIDFRQTLARGQREFISRGSWFFTPWNAEEVTDAKSRARIPFADASQELLGTDPNCWVLHPGEAWHGFSDLQDGWCMLDPTKAGVVCPGMGVDGSLEDTGIPASLVTAYLVRHGIIPARTTDFMVLFLFSIGITRGKWATLINTLLDFKRDYDGNTPLEDVLPALTSSYPHRYDKMGLRDLGNDMFAHMKEQNQVYKLEQAFQMLPTPVMTPRKAYQRLVAGEVELLSLDKMANRVSAVGVLPYPPGIPVIMPGENIGEADAPVLGYLRTLQEWGRHFPGFEHDVEGAQVREGIFHIYCLKSSR